MDKKSAKTVDGEESDPKTQKTTLSQVSLTGTTTVINSGGILYLFYRFFKLEESYNISEKKEKVIIKNTNTLNIQFKRWVSILAGQQLRTNDDIDELRSIVMRQGEQIKILEEMIIEDRNSRSDDTYNPMSL